MAAIEQLEIDAHRAQLRSDLRALVEKYRAIFDWDIPGVDQADADKLIIDALRKSLGEMVDQTTRRAVA